MELLLYFVVGALLDILATLDTQYVIDRKPLKSAIMSFTLTVIWVFILSSIILSPDKFWATISYALGGAIGSYFIVRRKRSK